MNRATGSAAGKRTVLSALGVYAQRPSLVMVALGFSKAGLTSVTKSRCARNGSIRGLQRAGPSNTCGGALLRAIHDFRRVNETVEAFKMPAKDAFAVVSLASTSI